MASSESSSLDRLRGEIAKNPDEESLRIETASRKHIELVAELKCLVKLHLINPNIDALEAIGQLSHLQELLLTAPQEHSLECLRDLQRLEELTISRSDLTDLAPLNRLSRLRNLKISDSTIQDFRQISQLQNIQTIRLHGIRADGEQLSDLTPLANLGQLEELIADGPIRSLEPIAKLVNLKSIVLDNPNVADLHAITELRNLEKLVLKGKSDSTGVTDLEPLRDLSSLKVLDVSRTLVEDLKPLGCLTSLNTVDISHTKVADLGPLRGLTSLESLGVGDTAVADLGPLRGLTNLKILDVDDTKTANLEPLRELIRLQHLGVSHTRATDLGPLRELTCLESLDVGETAVENLEPLRRLTNLRNLDISRTAVENLEPLRGLTCLESLDVGETAVENLEPLGGLTNLRNLDISRTAVENLEPLRGLTCLESLDVGETAVENLEPLRGLTCLKSLDVGDTEVENLEPLRGLACLESLDVGDTEVENLEPLRDLATLKKLAFKNSRVQDTQVLEGIPNLGLDSRSAVGEDRVERNVIEVVDDQLAYQIKRILGLSADDIISKADALELTDLQIKEGHNTQSPYIQTLEGIQHFEKLRSLRLEGLKIKRIDPLASLTTLRSLTIRRCSKLVDLPRLGKLKELTKLEIVSVRLAPRNFRFLRQLVNLRELNLAYTSIANLSSLSELAKLRMLRLTGTQVSNLAYIRDLSRLKYLDLYDSRVDDVTEIVEVLNGNKNSTLRINDLSLKGLGDLRDDTMVVFENYRKVIRLKYLRESYIQVGNDAELQRFVQYSLGDLNDFGVKKEDVDNGKLRELDFSNFERATGRSLSEVQGRINFDDLTMFRDSLERLSLDGYQISDRDVDCISNMSNLTELNMNRTGLQVPQLEQLQRLGALRMLSISGAYIAGEDQWKQLERFMLLELLDISDTKISSLDPICELRLLRKLILADCRIGKLRTLKGLKRLDELRELSLENTRLKNKNLKFLRGMTNLTSLDLSRNFTIDDSSLPHLGRLHSLEVLNLSSTRVRDCNSLRGLSNLRILIVGHQERKVDELLKRGISIEKAEPARKRGVGGG